MMKYVIRAPMKMFRNDQLHLAVFNACLSFPRNVHSTRQNTHTYTYTRKEISPTPGMSLQRALTSPAMRRPAAVTLVQGLQALKSCA
eukprot:1161323-Pelagomonas_calceolata.AAC.3